jgi:hypothetical protein
MKDDFNRKYPQISAKTKYVLLRNGYDSEDYKMSSPLPPSEGEIHEKLTIVYTGSMYGKRNPYYLLDNVSELVSEGKVDINKIKFVFVGRMGSEIKDYLLKSTLRQAIETIPYIPHSESINYLLKADAMLLLIDEDKYSKMILSGKVLNIWSRKNNR